MEWALLLLLLLPFIHCNGYRVKVKCLEDLKPRGSVVVTAQVTSQVSLPLRNASIVINRAMDAFLWSIHARQVCAVSFIQPSTGARQTRIWPTKSTSLSVDVAKDEWPTAI